MPDLLETRRQIIWNGDLVLLDVNMPALSGDRLCSLNRSNGSQGADALVLGAPVNFGNVNA